MMDRFRKAIFWGLIVFSGLLYTYLSFNSLKITYREQSLIISLLCAAYLLIFFIGPFKLISGKSIFILSLLFSLILLPSPLKLHSDTNIYMLWGRVSVLGKMNPYRHPYVEFTNDPLFNDLKNISWAKDIPTLSPLFVHISEVLVRLSGGNFQLNQIYFKILFFSSFVLGALLIWKITENKQALYLYSLNPIVLIELVKESHAESLIVLLILFSIFLLLRSKHKSALISLTAASLIKVSYIIFIPFVFLANRRAKYIVQFLFIVAVLYFLFYYPLIGDNNWFALIGERLIHGNNDLFSINPVILIFFPITFFFKTGFIANYILASKISTIIGLLIYLIIIAKYTFRSHNFSAFIQTICITYLVYLFFVLNYFMPYYAPTAILLLSLNFAQKKEGKLFWLIPAITLYTAFYYQFLS